MGNWTSSHLQDIEQSVEVKYTIGWQIPHKPEWSRVDNTQSAKKDKS